MKLIIALGTGLLAFGSTFILPNNAFATEDVVESTTVAKPSQAELRTAINQIKSIENYHEYSLLAPDELAATTKFYREYNYLFELVKIAEALDANYDVIPAEELDRIILAAKNAETTCGYIFGTVRKNNITTNEAQAPDSSNNQATSSAPIQTSTPTVSSPKPQTSAQATVATVIATTSDQTPHDEPEQSSEIAETSDESEETPIAVPATGEVVKNNKPFFITVGIVALACFFIGSMIVLNRKKTYRPGRKF